MPRKLREAFLFSQASRRLLHSLRSALEPTGHEGLVQTVRGSGYRFSSLQD